MNGTGNGIDELERRISQRLHGHGRLAPDNDGWGAILDRIEQRGRARHRRRAAAAGLLVVGMVGSLVVLTGDDATRVSTTPAGPASTADPAADAASSAGLPRLVLDLPGFEVDHASSTGATGPWPDLGPLLVYGLPDGGLIGRGPVLFVRLVPAGMPYGLGEGPAVEPVDVAGRPGRLLPSGSPTASLAWPREDGSIVHLLTVGLGGALVAQGEEIERTLATVGAPAESLGSGLVLLRETPADPSAAAQAEVTYRSDPPMSLTLRLTSGGAYRLDDLLFDRLISAFAGRSTSVDGRPAVVITDQRSMGVGGPGRTLVWSPQPGVVAELVGVGVTEDELEAAAASIHEVDAEAWADLEERSGDAPFSSVPDGSEAEVMAATCGLRGRWLEAAADGNAAAGAAALTDLEALFEKSRSAGLGASGDTLEVILRLADAMVAGDVATVRSIPEGGACG
ncbi:MAG TPA: hypothetical protein VF244_04630 [Acidimicrobiales bacterium]